MSAPQSAVNFVRALGVPGEILFYGPTRSQAAILNSVSPAYNIIGATAFGVLTAASDQNPNAPIVAKAGNLNTLFFAGILVNPKSYSSNGGAGGPLSATLTLPNNQNAELLTMGEIIVTMPAACAVGDLVICDNTTGALATVPAGTSDPGGGKSFVPNATVTRYSPTGGGLAAIRLTN